jgi:hypothetical protein
MGAQSEPRNCFTLKAGPRMRPGLVGEPYPRRERYQQYVGWSGDHGPLDVAHARSIALNARAARQDARSKGSEASGVLSGYRKFDCS